MRTLWSAAVVTTVGLPALALGPAQPDNDPASARAPEPDRAVAEPEIGPAISLPQGRQGLTLSLTPRAGHAFSANLDDSEGDVSVTRAGADLKLTAPLGDRARFLFNTDAEASWYSFDLTEGPLGGDEDPFDDVYRVQFSPGVAWQLNRRWGLVGGFVAEFAGESGADVADAATYGGFAGARYAFGERFSLTFGLQAKSRLEDDALVLPMVGFEWRINDTLTLSTSGPGVRLAAAVSESVTVAIAGGWELREYRLDDEGPLEDGVVRDTRVPIQLEVQWNVGPRVSLSAGAGVVVWQEFEFDDDDGDEIADDNTDPAPFVGASATFRF